MYGALVELSVFSVMMGLVKMSVVVVFKVVEEVVDILAELVCCGVVEELVDTVAEVVEELADKVDEVVFCGVGDLENLVLSVMEGFVKI